MLLFLLVWIVLVAAAAGLAVGALRGRVLEGGPCAARLAAGLPIDRCQGCAAAAALRLNASRCGR